VPSRGDDTVYDKARAETRKGMDPSKSDSGSGKTGGSDKKSPPKGIPKAKPLDGPGSDKKSNSDSKFTLNFDPSVRTSATPAKGTSSLPKDSSGKTAALRTSGAVPIAGGTITTSGAHPAVRKPGGKPPPVPIWMILGGVAAALLVVVAIIIVVALLTSDEGGPAPDTSVIPAAATHCLALSERNSERNLPAGSAGRQV